MNAETVTCGYCYKPAELKRGQNGWLWECTPCDARVAAYENSPSKRPRGSLANAELRKARWSVAVEMDSMIQATEYKVKRINGNVTWRIRSRAFRWLAEELGVEPKNCDYSKLNLCQCQAAMALFKRSTPPWMTVT